MNPNPLKSLRYSYLLPFKIFRINEIIFFLFIQCAPLRGFLFFFLFCFLLQKAEFHSFLCQDDFRHTLQTKESKRINQNVIRSYKHQLFSETVSKIALNCYDNKRYICNDNINTYSFGHKDIKIKSN